MSFGQLENMPILHPGKIVHIEEPARKIPVSHEADLCVIGGSCTGLFAAIRAARLGARVILVEKSNCFGGVATLGLVNVWHSLWNTTGTQQIIAGLTQEVVERLERRDALLRREVTNPSMGFIFNSEELKLELDALVAETPGLSVLLHTQFASPHIVDGRIDAILVENKSGRSAIRARFFIDATGDGDVAARSGCSMRMAETPQPATACVRFSGWDTLCTEAGEPINLGHVLRSQSEKHGIPPGFAWGCRVPNAETFMLAGTRIYNLDPTNATDLTRGEIEGRRQILAIHDLLRSSSPNAKIAIEALPSSLGLRESRHIDCLYQTTGDDILFGKTFSDTIAHGSYRVDIHHHDKPGITLRYLDGTETYNVPGCPQVKGRWRPESTTDSPTYYSIPWRSLVPKSGPGNLAVAGRMLDADPVANGAIRVMVNLNQTGEAAGVAAALALDSSLPRFADVPANRLRQALCKGGSALA